MDIVDGRTSMPVEISISGLSDLPDHLIQDISARLSLRDFVRFHYGCSKAMRENTSAGVFKGEPFFLREPPRTLDALTHSFYAFSMEKWLQLSIPVRNYRPVSASGGLILFSGVGLPREECLFKMRRWWPLVIVNPISRESRCLSLGLVLPSWLNEETWYPNCYLHVQMGLKVNAASKTYKVVVHWKSSYMVQIFDSGSNVWSVVSVPRRLGAYANSSNDIILCRSCLPWDEHEPTLFDIGQEMLVDCRSLQVRTGVMANPRHIIRGYPTVGESCLYGLDYDAAGPATFIHIYKRDKILIYWQLVADVPLKLLCSYLEVEEIILAFLRQSQLVIHECGEQLLFSVTYGAKWCGMLYDLNTRDWIRHFIVNGHDGNRFNDGFFFQPQLSVCPC